MITFAGLRNTATAAAWNMTFVQAARFAARLAGIISGAWEDQGAGGGWSWVLSDLKSLLETGKGFMG